MIGQVENTLFADLHNSDLPIAYAVKIPSAIIIDHQLDKTYIVDESDDDSRINLILDDIKLINPIPLNPLGGSLSEENQEKFISGVQKA